MVSARPLPAAYAPYRWAPSTTEVAARHGLPPEHVLRFDQNTPHLPGVPQVPLGESFARLNDYPDGTYRELRDAAAAYVGVAPERIVVGAGADDLIGLVARTFLGPGRTACLQPPTYGLYAIATRLEGATLINSLSKGLSKSDLVWTCNPNNPTGEAVSPLDLIRLAQSNPDAAVVVDEAYAEYAPQLSIVPHLEEAPNVVVLRTLSKAFGFAALRVGFAVASPEVAQELESRRAPAPIAAPAARIAAAALREPRLDVESTIAERERVRSALLDAGYDCPPSAANFVFVRTTDARALTDRLEERGLVVRCFSEGIRATVRSPTDDDVLLRALGAEPPPTDGRRVATVVRTTAETALRIGLDLDGEGRARVATGIGFLDHLLALMAFHGGLDLEVVAAGDLDVDEHHLVEDVLASFGDALDAALGSRTHVARYGSATLPMDEARATAAIDLVRRPHAEIRLAFRGDRVGGLAVTLLPHALERLAVQAAFVLHVDAAGEDDHHVAEAAFKALGRALRAAVASGDGGSTKGTL
jgi:histidinol-phosphate aminotransferase